MNQNTFDQMMETGEFEKMFNENKINELLEGGELTRKQIDALVKLGQKMSKQELQKRQKDLAAQPGYKEHILAPLIKKIIAEQGRVRDPKTGRYIKKNAAENVTPDEPPKPSKETEQTAENVGSTLKKTKKEKEKVEGTTTQNNNETKDVKKSKKKTAKDVLSVPKMQINKAFYATVTQKAIKLKKGDSAANIAAKIFLLLSRKDKAKKLTINESGLEKTNNQQSKTYKKEEKAPAKKEGNLLKYALIAAGGAGILYFMDNIDKFTGIEEMQKKLKSFGDNLMKIIDESDIVKGAAEAMASFREVLKKAGVITTPDVSQLKEIIGKVESGGNYNRLVNVKKGEKLPEKFKGLDLSKMTLKEVLALQKEMLDSGVFPSSALGKYQTVRGTLKATAEVLDISLDTKFTPEIQERIGDRLLEDAGLSKFKAGKISEDEFMTEIAKIWAGMPVPKNMHIKDVMGERDVKAGQSYYNKVNNNAAGVSVDTVRKSIEEIKKPVQSTPIDNKTTVGKSLDTNSRPIVEEQTQIYGIIIPKETNKTIYQVQLGGPGQTVSGSDNAPRFAKPRGTQ